MKNEKIIGALIGLVGAVNNNGKTENTDEIVKEALCAEDSEAMLDRIHTEKFIISPTCKTCETPCGNTSDYDMIKLGESPEETWGLKLKIIDELVGFAKERGELHPLTYKALSYLAYDLNEDTYAKLLKEMVC